MCQLSFDELLWNQIFEKVSVDLLPEVLTWDLRWPVMLSTWVYISDLEQKAWAPDLIAQTVTIRAHCLTTVSLCQGFRRWKFELAFSREKQKASSWAAMEWHFLKTFAAELGQSELTGISKSIDFAFKQHSEARRASKELRGKRGSHGETF